MSSYGLLGLKTIHRDHHGRVGHVWHLCSATLQIITADIDTWKDSRQTKTQAESVIHVLGYLPLFYLDLPILKGGTPCHAYLPSGCILPLSRRLNSRHHAHPKTAAGLHVLSSVSSQRFCPLASFDQTHFESKHCKNGSSADLPAPCKSLLFEAKTPSEGLHQHA